MDMVTVFSYNVRNPLIIYFYSVKSGENAVTASFARRQRASIWWDYIMEHPISTYPDESAEAHSLKLTALWNRFGKQ